MQSGLRFIVVDDNDRRHAALRSPRFCRAV